VTVQSIESSARPTVKLPICSQPADPFFHCSLGDTDTVSERCGDIGFLISLSILLLDKWKLRTLQDEDGACATARIIQIQNPTAEGRNNMGDRGRMRAKVKLQGSSGYWEKKPPMILTHRIPVI
jgi:hypothetical protein